jgi:hypothetical protein
MNSQALAEPIINETMQLLSGDLEIDRSYFPKTSNEEEAWATLRKLVAEKVQYLMEHDVEQLKYVLYRLDINERKVKTVLAESPFGEAPAGIAELILKREMEKARTRLQYGTGSSDWLDV